MVNGVVKQLNKALPVLMACIASKGRLALARYLHYLDSSFSKFANQLLLSLLLELPPTLVSPATT